MKKLYCSLLLLSTGWLSAQSAPGISFAGADYSAAAAFEVAPGQVITFYLRGVKPSASGALRAGRAETAPLPTVMAGLSARVFQGADAFPVPIFALSQENQCGDTLPVHEGCVLTTLRAQIPFEMSVAVEPGAALAAPVRLVVDVDGRPAAPLLLQPVAVNSHVLTTCDLQASNRADTCERAVFHSDGVRVTPAAPAKRGEVVTIYAFGLGPVSPPVTSGAPSPAGADVQGSGVLRVWTTIRNEPLNANPLAPRYYDVAAMSQSGSPGLQFAGLVPGFVGLYQLNIQVPESFEPILPCGGDIRANALLLVSTRQGSEVAPFCVQPQAGGII